MLITSFIPLWIAIIFITLWDLQTLHTRLAEQGAYYYDFGEGYELIIPSVSIAEVISTAYQQNTTQLIFSGLVLIFTAVATVYALLFVRRKNRQSEKSASVTIIEARKSTTVVTDFLLFYILPMIAFDFSSVRDILLFVIYFAFIAFLSIRNGNVYTNVLFEFMGYKVYKCDIEKDVLGKPYPYYECAVISKSNLVSKAGEKISCFSFENTIYLNVSSPQKGEPK